jgi:hypothetical protein
VHRSRDPLRRLLVRSAAAAGCLAAAASIAVWQGSGRAHHTAFLGGGGDTDSPTLARSLSPKAIARLGARGLVHTAARHPDSAAGSQPVVGPITIAMTTNPPLASLCTPGTVAAPSPLPGASSGGPGGMAAPSIGFLGLKSGPPNMLNFGGDISGAAGPNDYVETINTTIAIFKRNGTLRCAVTDAGALWNGAGGPCQINGYSDAVVLFDQKANQWFVSRFANDRPATNTGNWFQCMAISKTSDPTKTWFRYTIPISRGDFPWFNDYPKFGIWRDAYYMTANANKIYPGGKGIYVLALERAKMLTGANARAVWFFLPRTTGTTPTINHGVERMSMLQPAGFDGPNVPSAGTPEFLIQALDNNLGWPLDELAVWAFHVDWSNPSASTLKLDAELPVSAFDANVCEPISARPPAMSQSCIAQQGTSVALDPLAYGYEGYRVVYRRFNAAPAHMAKEDLVLAQTVAVVSTNQTGIRWYILGQEGGGSLPKWKIEQTGSLRPHDANDRWIPTPAFDKRGDLAIAYNVSGAGLFPSIRYAGRRASDAPGKLPRHEATAAAGSAPQTNNSLFGDYNQLVIDPTNDCRFWLAASFYDNPADGAAHKFSTAVASFRFKTCA